jgi:hypothetical protein
MSFKPPDMTHIAMLVAFLGDQRPITLANAAASPNDEDKVPR